MLWQPYRSPSASSFSSSQSAGVPARRWTRRLRLPQQPQGSWLSLPSWPGCRAIVQLKEDARETLSREYYDRKAQADVKKYGKISVREKGAADSEEAAYKRAQESPKAYRRSATKESTKTSCALSRFPGLDMAKYLAGAVLDAMVTLKSLWRSAPQRTAAGG